MKSLIVLGLLFSSSVFSAEVCKMEHKRSSGSSEVLLFCSGKPIRTVVAKEYEKGRVKMKHLQKKVDVIEELVDKGYTVISDSLFVKY